MYQYFASGSNAPPSKAVASLATYTPALIFSCGMDALSTAMISGRLLYYHHREAGVLGKDNERIYISAVTICIESGLLSTVSKILPLAIPFLSKTMIVIPLTVSWTILRIASNC